MDRKPQKLNKGDKDEPSFEIKSSPVWYSDRKSYRPEEVGKPREKHDEQHGFETINGRGVVIGKPMDEKYYDEYKEIYRKVFNDLNAPILFNINFGHSVPKCILPYDAEATVDYDTKKY